VVAKPEICICAAIQMPDGYVIRGHRHDDCYLNLFGLRKRDDPSQPRYTKAEGHAAIQGFVTSWNRFVGREEAMTLQRIAGAGSAYSHDGKLHGKILFSEDLY
jgi:hypothetical protein